MVFKYYFPERSYSFEELDKLSNHIKGKWTWQGTSLLALSKMGFSVINIENLDYREFSKYGKKYLQSIWTDKIFSAQNKFSDLEQEQEIAKTLIKSKKIKLINKEVKIEDIEKYFYRDFMVLVSINPFVLKNEKFYGSHMVIITNIDRRHVTFHNPGLPPFKNKIVSRKLFVKAMSRPLKEDNNLIALKFLSKVK